MAKSPRTTPASTSPKAAAPKAPAAPRKARRAEPVGPSHNGTDEDAIAQRAYEIYQERGGEHGADIEDWLQAEREVRSRRSGTR